MSSPTPPSEDVETRKRKRHCFTRSKAGCQTCRRQKKKCDEARPACGRCTSFGRTCSYSMDSPSLSRPRSLPIPSPIQSDLRSNALDSSTTSSLSIATSMVREQTACLPTPGGASSYPLPDISFAPTQPTSTSMPATTSEIPDWLLDGVHPGLDLSLPGHQAMSNGLPGMDHGLPPSADLGGMGISDAFWETFLGPLTQPVIPLPAQSPSVPTSTGSRPSGALLSVPLLCDSSLWSSFVDSSLWDTRSVPGDDGPLLEHFSTFASTTIVVRNDQTSAFFAQLADKATKDKQDALMHAVLCTSAVHLANWALKVNDQVKGVHFAEQAAQHRAQALHCLRVSSAKNDELDEEMNAATMILLIVSGVLRGDTDVMPSFISRAATMLSRVKVPRQDTMLPSISALHSMYTGLHSVASGKQIDINALFPRMDDRNIWDPRSEEVIESVLGIRKEMFLLFVRVNTLLVEHDTISAALAREGGTDEELSMMQIELQSECSTIEVSFNNEIQWIAKYITGCVERTQIGHECFRLAIQLMIVRQVFKYPAEHPRVRLLSTKMIEWLEKARPTTEIGLLFPLIIGGTEAHESLQERYRAFCQRCMWKGSVGPRTSASIIEDAWAARKEGRDESWRNLIQAKGSPLLV